MVQGSTKRTNRKADIVKASADLFEKVGYHRASMQMVAEEVGLGKPTLYHYFKSKNEILYAIHQETISKVRELHEKRVSKNLPPDELLHGMAKDMLTFIKEHPGYVRAFFEHFDELDDAHKKDIRAQRVDYFDAAIKVLEDGIKAGIFKKSNPRITAYAFFGMMNWTYKWVHTEGRTSVSTLAKTLCNLFLDGLRS